MHAQRLVGFERAQARDDAVEAFPVAGGAADAAIDYELVRLLSYVRVELFISIRSGASVSQLLR